MRSTTLDRTYRNLLMSILAEGIRELNERTQTHILMLEGGHSFKLDLIKGRLPVPGNRSYWPRVAAAEVAWQFMGTRSPEWILEKAPKVWQDFVEDGKLKTAYGYRWQSHFGRDQIDMAVHELKHNPTNRQLYISAWDPATDGLGAPDQPKNIPCPVGFSLTRTDDRNHCSVFMRSSDVFVGLPYDIMGYALTLDAIAAQVDCTPGTLHFTLAHAHAYEPHFKAMKECTEQINWRSTWQTDVQPVLPGWTIDMIQENPDGYVDHVKRLSNRVNRSTFNPMPEVIV